MKKQTHHLHALRTLLFTLLIGAVGIVQADVHAFPRLSYSTDSSVLAYATSISRGDLLAAANSSRAANGLAPLSLNSALNSSAQMKAQHMVDNNYWAHVAPDGTQPWYFFELAGYNYTAAGENLAYGFATSADTNTGWMNSPTHKANILGNYKDVGFGFVNGSSFQGGQHTVVVAHYGTAPAPKPAPKPAPAPSPSPTPTPVPEPLPTSPEPTQTLESTPVESVESEKETENTEVTESSKPDKNEEPEEDIVVNTQHDSAPPIATGETKRISVLQSAFQGSLPTMASISLGVVVISAIGYVATHRSLMQHALVSGEQFALHHPAFDALAIFTAVALILLTTVAQLQ